jgi:branched-chain amino acid transport system substrate-binding protein
MVYIGTFNSGAAKVSIPIMSKAGIVMISPANTYPGLTKSVTGVTAAGEPASYYPGSRNYFRIVPDDDLQGPVDANFVATKLKAKSVFIIDDGEDYGTGLAKAFEIGAGKLNMKVLSHDSITGKESDYKSLANKIKGSSPDAIFFGGISQQQAGKLLADIRAAGVKVPFVGGDGINDDAFVKDSGSAGEGSYSSVGGIDPAGLPQKGQDFISAYKAKYGDTIQAYTAYGYESMSVALAAIQTAGKKDRAAILQAVANVKDFDGVLGKWSFDKNGDTTQTNFSFYVVKNGQWVYDSSATAGS